MDIFVVKRPTVNRSVMINADEVIACEAFPSDVLGDAYVRFAFRHGAPVYIRGLTNEEAERIWIDFVYQDSFQGKES